jgi:hypothetical protein
MTLNELLINVSTDLHDYDPTDEGNSYVHWSKQQLIAYYNEAMCLIASTYKQNDFVVSRIIKLRAGISQDVCCNLLGAIVEQVDEFGNFIGHIRPMVKDKLNPWIGKACNVRPENYKVQNIYTTSEAPSQFEVNPPVPPVGSFYVKAKCSEPPNSLGINDLNKDISSCKYNPAVVQYMLYRALANETESGVDVSVADRHQKLFFDLLNVQVKSERYFKSAQGDNK